MNRLGQTGAISFEAPAGTIQTLSIVIGCFIAGVCTTRIEAKYFYTRYFGSLEHVLSYGFSTFHDRRLKSLHLDRTLMNSQLSESQQFLVAHAVRSYYGNTELLDVAGRPSWIVNEGCYCMMNTLDLSIDQMFFELRMNPWVVRSILDLFRDYYSYVDEVVDPETKQRFPGGLTFTHDVGVRNHFSPKGYSSYERPRYTDCFSYMTQEQLCNWILIAATYTVVAGNDGWIGENRYVFEACLESMLRRDHPSPNQRNGIMGFDSSRCEGGTEITTYDSLDPSLRQSRNSCYIACKCWASYLGLVICLKRCGSTVLAERAMDHATLCASSIQHSAKREGWIPAVLESDKPGFDAVILPAVEGLAYPLFWKEQGLDEARVWIDEDQGPFRDFLLCLRDHVRYAFTSADPSPNRFPDGAIRLSSSTENSWLSKIAIFQYIADRMFRMTFPDADPAHVRWLIEGTAARNAMCDQFESGRMIGSAYYPRVITTQLWWNPPL